MKTILLVAIGLILLVNIPKNKGTKIMPTLDQEYSFRPN